MNWHPEVQECHILCGMLQAGKVWNVLELTSFLRAKFGTQLARNGISNHFPCLSALKKIFPNIYYRPSATLKCFCMCSLIEFSQQPQMMDSILIILEAISGCRA